MLTEQEWQTVVSLTGSQELLEKYMAHQLQKQDLFVSIPREKFPSREKLLNGKWKFLRLGNFYFSAPSTMPRELFERVLATQEILEKFSIVADLPLCPSRLLLNRMSESKSLHQALVLQPESPEERSWLQLLQKHARDEVLRERLEPGVSDAVALAWLERSSAVEPTLLCLNCQ